jgi:hypothetical protein
MQLKKGCPKAINVINVGDLKSGGWTLYVWEEIFSDDSRSAKGFAIQIDKGLT